MGKRGGKGKTAGLSHLNLIFGSCNALSHSCSIPIFQTDDLRQVEVFGENASYKLNRPQQTSPNIGQKLQYLVMLKAQFRCDCMSKTVNPKQLGLYYDNVCFPRVADC